MFLVLLAYATGLRRSEVAKARLGDLQVRHFAEKSVWFLAVHQRWQPDHITV